MSDKPRAPRRCEFPPMFGQPMPDRATLVPAKPRPAVKVTAEQLPARAEQLPARSFARRT
jgi:hypothetical protein